MLSVDVVAFAFNSGILIKKNATAGGVLRWQRDRGLLPQGAGEILEIKGCLLAACYRLIARVNQKRQRSW